VASELSEGVRFALTDVKSFQLGLPGAAELTAIQVESARQTLDNVLLALQAAQSHADPPDGFPIELSESLLGWITTLHRGVVISAERFEATRSRLAHLPTTLTNDDFALLDQLLILIEAHASHLYHRLPVGSGSN
jgi:hypothetical protein